MRYGAAVAALAAALAVAPAAHPQASYGGVQPLVRLDAFIARRRAIQLGVGADVRLSRSLRLEVVGAAGSSWRDGDATFSARAEAVGRFLLDPDFTSRWGAYVGGGAAARYDRGPDWRGVLVVLVGVEGRRWRGVVPFGEVGLEQGVRLSLGVRRARRVGR